MGTPDVLKNAGLLEVLSEHVGMLEPVTDELAVGMSVVLRIENEDERLPPIVFSATLTSRTLHSTHWILHQVLPNPDGQFFQDDDTNLVPDAQVAIYGLSVFIRSKQ